MVEEQKLEDGDIAQLRSGGPLMSVEEITDNQALCTWFDEAGKLQKRRFLLAALRKVSEADESRG
jgi:uncharacterized protein YodC (DUF2158 family)